MTTLEPKTCERCGDGLKETLHSGGVKVDHFACGTIVYESGVSMEGLRCARRQRDQLLKCVEELRVFIEELTKLRAAEVEALEAKVADWHKLADSRAAEVHEAQEREACLRRKVVNLTEAVKKTIPAGLWLELVVALRENWEDTPEHWREINAIIRRAEVGVDDATGAEHSGGAVSPAAPGPGPV